MTSWATLGSDAAQLREQVFVQVQGVPLALAYDDADQCALHAVAYNRMGTAVATGRVLLDDEPGLAVIGRMAVIDGLRGGRIGAQVLARLMQLARAGGQPEVQLDALTGAEAFYRRAGFGVLGQQFEQAGITHIRMQKALYARWTVGPDAPNRPSGTAAAVGAESTHGRGRLRRRVPTTAAMPRPASNRLPGSGTGSTSERTLTCTDSPRSLK